MPRPIYCDYDEMEREIVALDPLEHKVVDDDWVLWMNAIDTHVLHNRDEPMFSTDVQLSTLFLDEFSHPPLKQYHNCRACLSFLDHFGSLVTVQPDGKLLSLFFGSNVPEVPTRYQSVAQTLRNAVEQASITHRFFSDKGTWGTRPNDPHSHFYILSPPIRRDPNALMGAARTDFETLSRALKTWEMATIDTLITYLDLNVLPGKEKYLKWIQWLRTQCINENENVRWLAVATSPTGWTHPKASVLGNMLDMIQENKPIPDMIKAINEMLDPLQYQRPTTTSQGNQSQFDKLVDSLGLRPSLFRRYATLDEVEKLWVPGSQDPPSYDGQLSSVDPIPKSVYQAKPERMTWVKFRDMILTKATAIEYKTPSAPSNYIGYVTSISVNDPPILEWDRMEESKGVDHPPAQRNPFSAYVFHKGSDASMWNLTNGMWVKVSGITLAPWMWYGGNFPHHGKFVTFLLESARPTHPSDNTALFPAIVRKEFHPVRSSLEEWNRTHEITGSKNGSACGVAYQSDNQEWNAMIKVCQKGIWVSYLLDRWD